MSEVKTIDVKKDEAVIDAALDLILEKKGFEGATRERLSSLLRGGPQVAASEYKKEASKEWEDKLQNEARANTGILASKVEEL